MTRRLIVPSAKADFERIGGDYGIRGDLDNWCRLIATEAGLSDRPLTGLTEVPFEAIIGQLEAFRATPGSEWARAWQEFRSAGWLKRAKALKILVTTGSVPWALKVNSHEFRGLDGAVPVEVEVVYKISRVDETVTFLRFEAFTPVPPTKNTAEEAQTW
jgi:hypothetical protein